MRPPALANGAAERIRFLARKLEEKTILNTENSRASCRELALDILELLEEEDARQDGGLQVLTHSRREAVVALRHAVRSSRTGREQSELTRLFTSSERLERKRHAKD